MQVQLFGLRKSQPSRKAQRFFAERRIPVAYHDLAKRAPSPGELRKWVQRFGVDGVLDPQSKAYAEEGLRFVSAGEDDWLERMAGNPLVLRLPLARCGTELTVGEDPEGWQRLAEVAKGR
jgi:arsenate reductase (glutaredoxin)